MNFSVTLFRSDFKKNELFITMSQNSNSQLPYSQIQEIRVSQYDDDGNGEDNGTTPDDSTGESKPTSSATQSRIEKRVPRNLLTRKAK